MADGIFTDDELKAQEQTEGTLPQSEETAEQKAERERDEHGRFKAKEADPETTDGGETDDGKQKTVPQEALHAERKKRQSLEAEIAPLREQLAALAKMREQIAGRKPEAPPAADDPAAIEHLTKRLADLEAGQTRVTQHIDTQAVDAAEIQQLGGFVSQAEAAYRHEKPDYDAAISYVVQARARELHLYGLNPAQVAATISEEAAEIARSAIAQNRNPAELGYQVALSRGYRPQKQEDKPNGQDATVAQRTLDAIAEAKRQGKSLGGSGGGKSPVLTAEAVAAMSPEEFEAIYSTPEGKAMIDGL
jgi:hypothetical protein